MSSWITGGEHVFERALFPATSSGSFGPILVQPSHSLVLGHHSDCCLVEADTHDEHVNEFSGESFSRYLWLTSVRLDPILNTAPEPTIRDIKLVAKDVAPDTRPAGGPIDGMRNPGPEDAAVLEAELIGDVMSSRASTRVSYLCPILHPAELFVSLP